jgi:hypothetical protein
MKKKIKTLIFLINYSFFHHFNKFTYKNKKPDQKIDPV